MGSDVLKYDLGFAYLGVDIDTTGRQPTAYISLYSKIGEDRQDICSVSQAVDPDTREDIPNSVCCGIAGDPNEYVIKAHKNLLKGYDE